MPIISTWKMGVEQSASRADYAQSYRVRTSSGIPPGGQLPCNALFTFEKSSTIFPPSAIINLVFFPGLSANPFAPIGKRRAGGGVGIKWLRVVGPIILNDFSREEDLVIRGGPGAAAFVRGGRDAELEHDREADVLRVPAAAQERQAVPRTLREPYQHRDRQGRVDHRRGAAPHPVPQRHRQQVVRHRPEDPRQVRQLHQEPLLLQAAQGAAEAQRRHPRLLPPRVPRDQHQRDLQDRGGLRGAVQGEAQLRPRGLAHLPRDPEQDAQPQHAQRGAVRLRGARGHLPRGRARDLRRQQALQAQEQEEPQQLHPGAQHQAQAQEGRHRPQRRPRPGLPERVLLRLRRARRPRLLPPAPPAPPPPALRAGRGRAGVPRNHHQAQAERRGGEGRGAGHQGPAEGRGAAAVRPVGRAQHQRLQVLLQVLLQELLREERRGPAVLRGQRHREGLLHQDPQGQLLPLRRQPQRTLRG